MVRKAKGQAAITRERLLDAAERVFCESGVARTSLTEVAARAGVTRGAVYWHFRDKADLLGALCERATLPLDALARASGAWILDDPLGALRSFALTAFETLASDLRTQAVFEVVFHKAEPTGKLVAIAGRRERDRRECQSNVESILERAVGIGQLPADTDIKLAARLFYASLSGVMLDWVADKGAYDLGGRAAPLVDSMLAGLVERPPRRGSRVRPRVRPRSDMV